MSLFKITMIIIAIWNIIVSIMYGFDKRKAKRGAWRVSEKTLLLPAAFMGGLGALVGMYHFHHKTNHLKFKIGVPLLLLFNIAVGLVAILLLIN